MKTDGELLPRVTLDEQRALTLPATLVVALVDIFTLIICLGDHPQLQDCWLQLLIGGAGLVYILVLYFILQPLVLRHSWLNWLIVLVNSFGIALLPLNAGLGRAQDVIAAVLMVAVVVVTVILAGRWPTYGFISLYFVVSFLLSKVSLTSTEAWTQFIGALCLSIIVAETILRLGKITTEQMRRLETINRISHQIATTIEPNELIALINAAVRDVVSADTYFMGTVQENSIKLEVFYDDGEYFPPQELPLEDSLSGWVVREKRSLLFRDAPVESAKIGVQFHMVGKEKTSLSWMGVPLEADGRVIGVMAVASYRKAAFSQADLNMLESVAQQAALVMDNAYHHAEVEEESHRDSLTRVYNHGYFLVFLNEYAAYSLQNQIPMSLIMLDIDFFKQYNDTYGHQVGDEVLVRIVEAIQNNIRSSDIIGRWGGEEFAILLPDADGPRALNVASRIRETLQTIQLADRSGRSVQAPTVSQGLAVFPAETEQVEVLIHLADQRLYQAKGRGRDQVEPPASLV